MMKFGSIFVRIKFHIMNYTIEDIQVLAVNLVREQSRKARILELEDGGGKMILTKNAVCIGKKVNNC
jgi:hypothetical protein